MPAGGRSEQHCSSLRVRHVPDFCSIFGGAGVAPIPLLLRFSFATSGDEMNQRPARRRRGCEVWIVCYLSRVICFPSAVVLPHCLHMRPKCHTCSWLFIRRSVALRPRRQRSDHFPQTAHHVQLLSNSSTPLHRSPFY